MTQTIKTRELQIPVTPPWVLLLSGDVIDQAQLHGYIERFEEFGLELLTVEQTGKLP